MTPQPFEESNVQMKKPESMTDQDCGDMPAWHGMQNLPSGTQYPCFISYWKPSHEELQDLNNGGGIYLTIVSSKLPPTSLDTKNPFVQTNANGTKKN